MIIGYANNAVSGFTACKHCNKVLAIDIPEIGTLSQRKHIKNCKGTTGPQVKSQDLNLLQVTVHFWYEALLAVFKTGFMQDS